MKIKTCVISCNFSYLNYLLSTCMYDGTVLRRRTKWLGFLKLFFKCDDTLKL